MSLPILDVNDDVQSYRTFRALFLPHICPLPPSRPSSPLNLITEPHEDTIESKLRTLDLCAFLNLHDDILYQILQHLDPEDGLTLLKVPTLLWLVCPLSSEIASPLWHCWIRVEGAPECPDGVNLLRWVDVLFGEHICDTCGDLNTPPEPRLLRRICRNCWSNPDFTVLLPCSSAGSPSSHPLLPPPPAPDERLALSKFQTYLLNMPALCVNLSGAEPQLEICKDETQFPTYVMYMNPEWYVVRTEMYTMEDGDVDEYVKRRGEVVDKVYEKEGELTAWIAKYRTLKKPSWVATQESILATIMGALHSGYDKITMTCTFYTLPSTPTLRHYDGLSTSAIAWLLPFLLLDTTMSLDVVDIATSTALAHLDLLYGTRNNGAGL
ncbi:hypothetical protein ONZ45_g16090 [Pleurotus djamor]|nr:hypothetical protein ONZ45_g16090 [Pleurotus djamor]